MADNGPDYIPAPMYEGATQDALNGDIEADLDDDKILSDHAARNTDNQDTYARQALLRSQQELAAANAKVGQLEQTTQTLAQDHQYLRGQLDTLATTNNSASAEAQRQAELQKFALTEAEQASYGESISTVEKIVGRALYEQEQRLNQQFEQRLAQQTRAAVDPLMTEVNTLKQGSELQHQQAQRNFDQQVGLALSQRGTTLPNLLRDPVFLAKSQESVPGTGRTYLDFFRDNANNGDVNGMMEFVDSVLQSAPHQPNLTGGPSGNSARVTTTTADAAKLEKRNSLQAKLEAMEYANSVGDYKAFGGSRTKFMEERNKVLLEIERNPL